MQNLKHFVHYHKGTPPEKTIKIVGSFLILFTVLVSAWAGQLSVASEQETAFIAEFLPEPSYARVGVEEANLPRAINQSFLQIKRLQRSLPDLPREKRVKLTVKVFELSRLHDLAKNCYKAGNFSCAEQAVQKMSMGPTPLPAMGPTPLPAMGPTPLPAMGPTPLPAAGPTPLPAMTDN